MRTESTSTSTPFRPANGVLNLVLLNFRHSVLAYAPGEVRQVNLSAGNYRPPPTGLLKLEWWIYQWWIYAPALLWDSTPIPSFGIRMLEIAFGPTCHLGGLLVCSIVVFDIGRWSTWKEEHSVSPWDLSYFLSSARVFLYVCGSLCLILSLG